MQQKVSDLIFGLKWKFSFDLCFYFAFLESDYWVSLDYNLFSLSTQLS